MNLINKNTFVLLILIGIVGILYYPALNFSYVWDDTLLFVSKTGLLTEPLSWSLISEPVLPGTTYFRPLVFLSWYLEFNVFGQHSGISHFIGLIMFYINCCLVYCLAYQLAEKTHNKNKIYIGFGASLFYLFHPALIESTAWVSGRFDQFATLFILLACWLFVKDFSVKEKPKAVNIILINLSFICALLSKELGIVLPLILLCLYFALMQKNTELSNFEIFRVGVNKYKLLIMVTFFTFIVYLFLRNQAMHGMYHASLTEDYVKRIILNDLAPLYALAFYVQKTFLPFSGINILHPYFDYVSKDIFSYLKITVISLFILFVFYMAWIGRSLSAWLAINGLLSVFLVLHFIPLGIAESIGHERFMTLGLAFMAISLAFIPYESYLDKIGLKRGIKKLIFSSILLSWFLLSILTIKSILPLWKNDYSLWSWTYKIHPESSLARYNYLYGALDQGNYQEVIKEAKKYIKNHGGLEVRDQLLYANALIGTFDEEGLKYLEGGLHALPKFHENREPDARRQADFFVITAGQIGGAYVSYAVGQLIFKNNPEEAIKYFSIADWYFLNDEKETLNYYLAAALFANKEYEKSYNIYLKQVEKSKQYDSKRFYLTAEVLTAYCSKNLQQKDICSKFYENKVFLKP
ncbi:hypothetical protein QR674_10015 [Acinetobacter chinensis]|uniref:Glycosyltransferase RgtA/B/C/D-like domain-containing protein n=1 Tax=Acinetobacter chinensis TaxID=2004650 RepID=A0ABU3WG04_9GAMM|nr:hypothetical protein [Acinetobacter chinensis]MDV2469320.1 hypothetical protein [Acinetobacter chinensis]